MICSCCKADKPDKKYPQNYGKVNGSTCLECRRKKYKTRVEVARSKVHEASPTRKKCVRCIDININNLGFSLKKAVEKAHFVKKGNYFHCEKCHEWASRVPEEYQGW